MARLTNQKPEKSPAVESRDLKTRSRDSFAPHLHPQSLPVLLESIAHEFLYTTAGLLRKFLDELDELEKKNEHGFRGGKE